MMDNKASVALEQLLQKRRTVVQVATPHNRRRSAGELAMLTFKKPFCGRIRVSRQKITYLSVVSNSEASGNNYKFTTNIKKKSKVIGICANIWNI